MLAFEQSAEKWPFSALWPLRPPPPWLRAWDWRSHKSVLNVFIYGPFHGAAPSVSSRGHSQDTSTRWWDISVWRRGWTCWVCDRSLWSCALWWPRLWCSWPLPRARDDGGPVSDSAPVDHTQLSLYVATKVLLSPFNLKQAHDKSRPACFIDTR